MDDATNAVFDALRLIRADPIAPLGLAIAALVTAHVLLHKRDVAASIGWIGLAWLSPIVGGLLYFLLGINRVRRRARVLRPGARPGAGHRDARPHSPHPEHFAGLERAARHITGRPAEPGNAVGVLRDGDAAYPAMLEAIAGARASVALSTYILRDDAAGSAFIGALIAAARRGVAVRVLLDGVGSGYFLAPAARRLRRGGVPVGRFMHSLWPWRMPFLNLRTHKKILLVDGRLGFTGGMNIGAENVLARAPRAPVRDTHFRLEGPVLAQLADAFARDWAFVTGEELDGERWFPPLPASGAAVARVITSGPDQDLEKIEFVVLTAIGCATRSIRLMTPYFIPDERLITALALAALRGVAVDVTIPARSNHLLVDWATRAHVGPLLAQGCRLWCSPPPFDHSKLLVIDETWCLVGSANWDIRSLRLNFELNVEFFDAALARELTRQIRSASVVRLTAGALSRRKLPIRLRDAAVRLMLPYL